MIDIRLRSTISDEELKSKVGKILTEDDLNVVVTGDCTIRKPNGSLLCVYRKGVLKDDLATAYDVLHSLRSQVTTNRGLASGAPRYQAEGSTRSHTRAIASAIVGAIDPGGQQRYCRLTAWTGANLPQYEALHPLLRTIAGHFAADVPQRYAVQMEHVAATKPEWVIAGTPFSTITVNNTYPTGVHTDKGDLEKGFSTLAVARRGVYTGGIFTFPQYRIGIDAQDGDLLLMDAHEWHGNTAIVCACGTKPNGFCTTCGAERISVVSYYRTRMAECGTAEEELARAQRVAERRSHLPKEE